MFPARFELATFRVLGGRNNHYTTETTVTVYLFSLFWIYIIKQGMNNDEARVVLRKFAKEKQILHCKKQQ